MNGKIQQHWETFATEVLSHVKTNSVQYIEMRKAFFAGYGVAALDAKVESNIASWVDEVTQEMQTMIEEEIRRDIERN